MEGIRKPKPHRIIVDVDQCAGKVIPGRLFAYPGDKIRFEAVGSNVLILLPEIDHFDGALVEKGLVNERTRTAAVRIQEGEPAWFDIHPDARPGRYPYAVYCESIQAFAVGNSDPTVIIRKRTDDGSDEGEDPNGP
jgi:hypothetical protein